MPLFTVVYLDKPRIAPVGTSAFASRWHYVPLDRLSPDSQDCLAALSRDVG
jgi:hypothetical protein